MVPGTLCEKGKGKSAWTKKGPVECSFPNEINAAVVPRRVANDRVAASRARLHDGHGAPVPCRPRTHAGMT